VGKYGFCYAAFLRGINVGGHAPIKMADLKVAFENMGFENVRTVLASGNVVFETVKKKPALLAKEIGAGLKKAFEKDIAVAVRGLDDLKKLQSSDPFKGITVTPSTRLYVTFLSEKTRPRTISIPYSAPEGEFRILKATAGEVISAVDLAKGKGTPEAMLVLEREFGSNLTTRNWNTVLKVLT
jgi:uncharacterized protein (DUF1697 family)